MYVLVQWEDRFLSVISHKDIVQPKKDASLYMEGERIEAMFEKKIYKAVISEMHEDRKVLLKQVKLPPKFPYYRTAPGLGAALIGIETAKTGHQDTTSVSLSAVSVTETKDVPTEAPGHMATKTELFTTATGHADDTAAPLVSVMTQPGHVPSATVPKHAKDTTTPHVSVETPHGPESVTSGNGHEAVVKASMNLLTKPSPQTDRKLNQVQRKETGVTYKEFKELQEQVRKLKRRVRDLEGHESSEKGQPSSPKVPTTTASGIAAVIEVETQQSYNGYSEDQLRNMISHMDKVFECSEKLLLSLFSAEYITNHSITGRRANTHTEAKPKIDDRLYSCFLKLIKEKFPEKKDTEITSKVQAIQKKCKKMSM